MNWKRIVAAAPLLFAFTSLPASAGTWDFITEFSGSGGTCANTSCATLTVVQDGADVDFTLTANLASGEFISGFYGNQTPFDLGAGSVLSITGNTSTATTTVNIGEDAFQADGDGIYDYNIDLSTAAGSRFDNSDVLTWTITNTTVAEVETLAAVGGGNGPFIFALRVQGLSTGSGSGWFSPTPDGEEPPTGTPEPGSLLLLGLGLAGLALTQRRRRRV